MSNWTIIMIGLLVGIVIFQELTIHNLEDRLRIEKEWARWWFNAYAKEIGYDFEKGNNDEKE